MDRAAKPYLQSFSSFNEEVNRVHKTNMAIDVYLTGVKKDPRSSRGTVKFAKGIQREFRSKGIRSLTELEAVVNDVMTTSVAEEEEEEDGPRDGSSSAAKIKIIEDLKPFVTEKVAADQSLRTVAENLCPIM